LSTTYGGHNHRCWKIRGWLPYISKEQESHRDKSTFHILYNCLSLDWRRNIPGPLAGDIGDLLCALRCPGDPTGEGDGLSPATPGWGWGEATAGWGDATPGCGDVTPGCGESCASGGWLYLSFWLLSCGVELFCVPSLPVGRSSIAPERSWKIKCYRHSHEKPHHKITVNCEAFALVLF